MTNLRTWAADWLPSGDTLPDDVFAARHRLLRGLMAAHAPLLLGFALVMGFSPEHSVAEVSPLVMLWLLDKVSTNRQLRAFWVTTGLVWSSTVLVHLSGGLIESHFHFFIVVGFIALYQQWVPFGWAFAFTIVSHGVGSAFGPQIMFNHPLAIEDPWVWALIHGGGVAVASVAQIVFWREAEQHQRQLVEAGLAQEAAETAARESALLVSMGRRNQSLLRRQLDAITRLEHRSEDPAVLGDLFTVDHLATRMRRNAESLMVLAGEDPSRASRQPVPITEIAAGAIAEVEQYTRARVSLGGGISVDGRVAPALTHLLAELVDNALRYSPPHTEVQIAGRRSGAGFEFEIVDDGVGLPADRVDALRRRARGEDQADLDRVDSLGLHVVGRIARRHGVIVDLLQLGEGLGTVARVTLPVALLHTGATTDAAAPAADTPAADAWATDHAPSAAPEPAPIASSASAPMTAAPVAPAAPVTQVEQMWSMAAVQPVATPAAPAPLPVSADPVTPPQVAPVAAATETMTTSAGLVLPQRRPAAHLDPNLKDLHRSAPTGLLGGQPARADGEDARRRADAMGAFQSHAVAGRAEMARAEMARAEMARELHHTPEDHR